MATVRWDWLWRRGECFRADHSLQAARFDMISNHREYVMSRGRIGNGQFGRSGMAGQEIAVQLKHSSCFAEEVRQRNVPHTAPGVKPIWDSNS
jgi:hypothetical protein